MYTYIFNLTAVILSVFTKKLSISFMDHIYRFFFSVLLLKKIFIDKTYVVMFNKRYKSHHFSFNKN